MKIAFLLVNDPVGSPPALVMAATVRKWMPQAELVQLTGENDEIVPGCTAQRIPRNGEPLMLYRFRHLMELDADELIALDTDIYVQSDLSKVFAFPFDVALTWRDGPVYEVSDVKKEVDLAKLMPYNSGVMFCRNRQFWRDCHAKLTALGVVLPDAFSQYPWKWVKFAVAEQNVAAITAFYLALFRKVHS